MLIQFLGAIDNGFERSVCLGEPAEQQAHGMTPSVRSEESEEGFHYFFSHLLGCKTGPIVIAILRGVLRVADISSRLP
jgi:hypothetical protein